MPVPARRTLEKKLGDAKLTIAVAGNPNSGKSTLFNALTGLAQKVANYPGVTVERVVGRCRIAGTECRLIDIPGAYSLAAQSPDEAIAAAALLGFGGEAAPDVTVVVVDATCLERGLYLISQVLELGRPTVVALNMWDLALRRGFRIDHRRLAARLQIPVVPLVAHRGEGLEELKAALLGAAQAPPPAPVFPMPEAVEPLVAELIAAANGNGEDPLTRGEAIRLLFDEAPLASHRLAGRGKLHGALDRARRSVAEKIGPGVETRRRTEWATALADTIVERPTDPDASWTSRLDRVLLHRFFGPLIMLALMLAVFQSIFAWAQPFMAWIDAGFAALAELAGTSIPPGPLQSLVADGVIGGVGAVLVFLPQILILFLFIGLLEDSGYMPRAAFLVDRLFKGCGLSGRSFIPLLSSFACAVPGIMATRTIDNRSQRFLTILVAPLMTCSARLPVYAILIAAFVPAVSVGGLFNLQGLTLAALYGLGVVVAAGVSLALKHTLLSGPAASFVMELPSYKVPTWSNIGIRMLQRGRAFVTRAGSVILAVTIVLWALSYYPRSVEPVSVHAAAAAKFEPYQAAERTAEREGRQLRNSYFGRLGRALEPLAMHLGWDWKITMAVLASFPAREVVIATLGTVYHLGADDAAAGTGLIAKLRADRWDHGPLAGQPVFTLPVALSVMVFFALCCQCAATLAVVRRETNSWRWPLFVFSYMSFLAIAGAWLAYQLGTRFGLATLL